MTKLDQYQEKMVEWMNRRGQDDFSNEEEDSFIKELDSLWTDVLEENQALFEKWKVQ